MIEELHMKCTSRFQNELVGAYNEVRNEFAMQKFARVMWI